MNIQRREDGVSKPEAHGPMSLREAMSRLFDESFWDPFEERGLVAEGGGRSLFPKVDISETEKEVRVVANVPGIDPEKVDVEVDEDSLSLSGVIEEEHEEKGAHHYRFEREYGEFRRDFLLPARVDPDAVSAQAKNGVITIVLPKVAGDDGKKKVSVKNG